MSEPKVGEKKVVGRNVAIALGIICIVLAASLVGTIIVLNLENANLQNQVNNLNAIINHEKTISEVWLSNKTFSISPNDNVSEWFYTPYSGDVKVEVYVEPPNLDVWVNLTWYVRYAPPNLYQVYPTPFIDNANYVYIEEEFPVVSFGQGNKYTPNVGITIGNNSTETVTTVKVTITFYY
jgi:hypothetical protein